MYSVNDIAEEVIRKCQDVSVLHNRLVFLVGEDSHLKDQIVKEVQERTGFLRVNVGLELSKRLLDLNIKERAQKVFIIFQDLLRDFRRENGKSSDAFILEGIEFLFEPSLHLLPVQLLQLTSRGMTLIVCWPGQVKGGFLTYADPSHAEYMRISAEGLVTVSTDGREEES